MTNYNNNTKVRVRIFRILPLTKKAYLAFLQEDINSIQLSMLYLHTIIRSMAVIIYFSDVLLKQKITQY